MANHASSRSPDGLPPVASVATATGLDRVAVDIVNRVSGMLGAERSALFLLDPATGELVSRHAQGARVPIRMAVGRGLCGWVAEHRRPVRVAEAYEDPRFVRLWDQASGKRTRSFLAVPLENPAGELVGVVASVNKAGGFDAFDEAALRSIATLAALHLDHGRLVRQLESGNREGVPSTPPEPLDLLMLHEVDDALKRADGARTAVEIVLARLRAAFGAAAVVGLVTGPEPIFVVDRTEGEAVHPAAAVEDNPPGLLGADAPAGTRIIRARLEVRGRHVGLLEVYHRGNPSPDPRIVALVAAHLGQVLASWPARSERSDRLAQVAQAVAEFVHDLRLPLSAALGYADLLVEEEDPKERNYFVRGIRAALEQIDAMATEILEFVRGDVHLRREATELATFLFGLSAQVEPDLARYSTRLEVSGDRDGSIRLDSARMWRVMGNLGQNAAQAGARTVRVRVERGPTELTMWIEDDGSGIPEAIRDRLFEPFASGRPGGTGLGLASVRRSVEAHGGSVELERTSAAGTSFRIVLPLDPEES